MLFHVFIRVFLKQNIKYNFNASFKYTLWTVEPGVLASVMLLEVVPQSLVNFETAT